MANQQSFHKILSIFSLHQVPWWRLTGPNFICNQLNSYVLATGEGKQVTRSSFLFKSRCSRWKSLSYDLGLPSAPVFPSVNQSSFFTKLILAMIRNTTVTAECFCMKPSCGGVLVPTCSLLMLPLVFHVNLVNYKALNFMHWPGADSEHSQSSFSAVITFCWELMGSDCLRLSRISNLQRQRSQRTWKRLDWLVVLLNSNWINRRRGGGQIVKSHADGEIQSVDHRMWLKDGITHSPATDSPLLARWFVYTF